MSDDVAPAFDEQDQPIDATEEAPETDQPIGDETESSTDFDPSELPDVAQAYLTQREKEMFGDYTKKTQALAEERRELAELRQFIESQGGQGEEEYEDPEGTEYADPSEQRLAQLEQKLAAQEIRDQFIDRVVELEETEGRELSKAEHNQLWKLVQADIAMYGEADPEEIWAEMKGLYTDREKAAEKKLLDGKTNTPRPPSQGKPGARQVDLSKETPDERRERMLNAAERSEASTTA